jgi:hypothetical protein
MKKRLKRRTDVNTTSDCEDERRVTARLGVTVENARIGGDSIGFVEVKFWRESIVEELI